MILLDSNVPMYLVGGFHTHKLDAQRLLESAISCSERLVTDAEVLQEICHRCLAIQRRDAIQPAFDAVLGVVDEVLPIERGDVEGARNVLLGCQRLCARDAVHIAVMDHHGISRIMSFDRGFDTYPGIERVH